MRTAAVASFGVECIDRDYITTCVLSLRAQHAPHPPLRSPCLSPLAAIVTTASHSVTSCHSLFNRREFKTFPRALCCLVEV